ncbi:MAG TPA: DUF305 domain-containing protein [Alphaproteobacteria bacterium]|nr:DUF305 domain-containing protein [Alphaproteobacteria bacterium]
MFDGLSKLLGAPARLKLLLGTALALSTAITAPSRATEIDFDEDSERDATTVVHEVDVLFGDQAVDPAVVDVDRDYVFGMLMHHKGALSMSNEYLADPRGTNPVLRRMAQAIIANQRFEIGVLDEVARRIGQPPRTILKLGGVRVVSREVGVDGLEHRWRYIKSPPPSAVDLWASGHEVTGYDVRFAKAMIVHHRGALDMARAYNADPNGQNNLLRRMNLDIITDQRYEIGFLEGVIARYSGNADAVEIDSSMVHGMDMTGHGTGHTGRSAHAGY